MSALDITEDTAIMDLSAAAKNISSGPGMDISNDADIIDIGNPEV